MSDEKTNWEPFGAWKNPVGAMRQLRAETGASLLDAMHALSDADYDLQVALRFLNEGRSQEWLHNRRIEIARQLEYEEYHKESLQEQFEQEMYHANKRIAELKEKLSNLG